MHEPQHPSARQVSGRPLPGEFAPYAAADIARVQGDDAVTALADQRSDLLMLLAPLDDDVVRGVTYAPGKWTLKTVLSHLADDERIYAYRMLCIARGDTRPLAGFDEVAYAAAAAGERRSWNALLNDYSAVREATISLLDGLPESVWTRRGTANDHEVSVRGLAFHIAGHELRHLEAIRERYWPRLNRGAVS